MPLAQGIDFKSHLKHDGKTQPACNTCSLVLPLTRTRILAVRLSGCGFWTKGWQFPPRDAITYVFTKTNGVLTRLETGASLYLQRNKFMRHEEQLGARVTALQLF